MSYDTDVERTLDALVEELRRDGEETFRTRYRAPVLLRTVAIRPDDDDDGGFHTEVHDRAVIRQTMELSRRTVQMRTIAPPAASPAHTSEIVVVHFVRKRPGGAFKDRVGIGRSADVTIPLPAMSKYHAFITVPDDPHGDYTLTDASSKNGTYVGSKRLAPSEPHVLRNGAELRFGPYPLTFHTADGLFEVVKKQA